MFGFDALKVYAKHMEPATESDRVSQYAEILETYDRIASTMEKALNISMARGAIGNGSFWTWAGVEVRYDLDEQPDKPPHVTYICEQTRKAIDGKVYKAAYRIGDIDMREADSPKGYGELLKRIHLVWKYEFEKLYKPASRPKSVPGEWYEAKPLSMRPTLDMEPEVIDYQALDYLIKETEKTAKAQAEAIKSILGE